MTQRIGASCFQGRRLHLARVFNGLSQAELGEEIGVTHAFISQVESGSKQPSALNLAALSARLRFEQGFFIRPMATEFRDEDCHFRRRSTTPVGLRNRVLAAGTLFGELVDFLDASVSLPKYDVPSIRASGATEVEAAAEKCRMRWGLGLDVPIKSMSRVLERAGAVVTRFPASVGKIDAFSRLVGRGIVVLNTDKGSTSRARFDLAHECGHLVLHTGLWVGQESQEQDADRFASAFLLPRAGFVREFPRTGGKVRLESLVPLKMRWKCSIAAIVRRAFDLKLIDGLAYQHAFRQIYARGWHKGEPQQTEPTDEPPEVVVLSLGVLRKSAGQNPRDVAAALGWTFDVLRQVVPAIQEGGDDTEPDNMASGVLSLDVYRGRKKLDSGSI